MMKPTPYKSPSGGFARGQPQMQSPLPGDYHMKQAFILIAAALAFFCGCAQRHGLASHAGATVFVSILPQKYFVDRISGGLVNCLVMVPPGTNEHSYEPHPAQMSLLSHAKAYFAIGLEFEGPWLPKFASMAPAMRIVPTDSLVPKMPSTDFDEPAATPSSEGGRPVAGLDPHIWLSPALVRQQAATIAAALEEIDTLHAAAYRTNFVSFLRGIDTLDHQLRAILACDPGGGTVRRTTFLVFHPTWGYFAKDYCLRQVAIEVEGKEPSPRMMKSILDTARFYRIRTVFVQPEFSRKSAEVIAHEIGAAVLDADALAYDWKDNLIHVAREIAHQ